MFPTLITGYTDEGNAILSLKGNVEKLRDTVQKMTIKQHIIIYILLFFIII